jgi:purine nucleoside permease
VREFKGMEIGVVPSTDNCFEAGEAAITGVVVRWRSRCHRPG